VSTPRASIASTGPKRVAGADLDVLGSTLAVLCAIHCAAMPFIALALPFAADKRVEMGLFAALALTALTIIGHGVRRHRRAWVAAPLVIGLGLLAAIRILDLEGNGLLGQLSTLVGSALIVTAHLLNRRELRACACCEAGTLAA
jgi:hypothetical protein